MGYIKLASVEGTDDACLRGRASSLLQTFLSKRRGKRGTASALSRDFCKVPSAVTQDLKDLVRNLLYSAVHSNSFQEPPPFLPLVIAWGA